MADHPNAPESDFPGDAPKNLPAKPPTRAAVQKQRMDMLLTAVESRQDMLVKLLADTGITFDRFLEVFRRALIRDPDLVEADAASVVEACINACTDGLLPDGRQGAIVVYNQNIARKGQPKKFAKRANWQPMYQGLLDIAYASGNFRSIEARVVYAGDHWEYILGDEPKIIHRPKSRPAGAAQPAIIASYAIAKTVNGGVFREVFEGADIAKVNAVSRATSGPGKDWPEEMAKKGPVRRMWKYLPKNAAMSRVLERDVDLPDLADLDIPDAEHVPTRQTARKGFAPAPAALTQGADMTVDMTMGKAADLETVDASFEDAGSEEEQQAQPDPGANEEPDTSADTQGDAPPAVDAKRPEVQAFEKQLMASTSWLNIKQALKTFRKTEMGQNELADRIACTQAWNRMRDLFAAGQDKTDFIADPLLFECWLLGADPPPDSDTVTANWAIIQQESAYKKLAEEERERITGRVTEALDDEG